MTGVYWQRWRGHWAARCADCDEEVGRTGEWPALDVQRAAAAAVAAHDCPVSAARRRHPSTRRRSMMQDDYIRVFHEDGTGSTVMVCIRCDQTLRLWDAALTLANLRQWVAAAEAHTCGGAA